MTLSEELRYWDSIRALVAILKVLDGPLPTMYVRIIATFILDPHVLTPHLSPGDQKEWRRLVGKDAEPRSDGDRDSDPPVDKGWGTAVRNLCANGQMVEDTGANTWAPGIGLDEFDTVDWATVIVYELRIGEWPQSATEDYIMNDTTASFTGWLANTHPRGNARSWQTRFFAPIFTGLRNDPNPNLGKCILKPSEVDKRQLERIAYHAKGMERLIPLCYPKLDTPIAERIQTRLGDVLDQAALLDSTAGHASPDETYTEARNLLDKAQELLDTLDILGRHWRKQGGPVGKGLSHDMEHNAQSMVCLVRRLINLMGYYSGSEKKSKKYPNMNTIDKKQLEAITGLAWAMEREIPLFCRKTVENYYRDVLREIPLLETAISLKETHVAMATLADKAERLSDAMEPQGKQGGKTLCTFLSSCTLRNAAKMLADNLETRLGEAN